MASLDEVFSKIPKPILVVGVMVIALLIMLKMRPLRDGCDVQISNFTDDVKGYLIKAPRVKKKPMVLPQVGETKASCKNGNSPGACANYFASLKIVSEAFVRFDHKCLPPLIEDENFFNDDAPEATKSTIKFQLKDAVKILALLAWGEKPPAGLSERAGWLSRSEIDTFCRLKGVLAEIIGPEEYESFRLSVMREYPNVWPDKLKNQMTTEDIQRPTVLKWSGNPGGTMSEKEVMQRSLFSYRCEQYQ